jgi:hypothetical protein
MLTIFILSSCVPHDPYVHFVLIYCEGVTENGENFVKRNFTICAFQLGLVLQILFLCQPSCVNWRMSRNSATLGRSGRVRTNLHDLL